ncbi:MAG: hypothetical protein HRU15_05505 [Planctomycetes bacterium]|nr:hypothetical protein [Planctomycetota bacterium]
MHENAYVQDGYGSADVNPWAAYAGQQDDFTGGFFITLARDVDPDDDIYTESDVATGQPAYNKISTAEEALQSITPFRRVFVNRDTGEILIRPTDHPDCVITAADFTSKDPYPNR